MNDANEINIEIIEEWVAGKGKHPVTWKTLTHVLCDIELSTLAEEIEKVTKDLYIMPVNYWYCTSYLHSRLSCCRNCYLSTLCKIYITYMVGHPLHFFNCVVTL